MVIADKRLWEEDGMGPVTDVKEVSVGEVFTKVGTTAVYEYDFGDGWMHHLELVDRSIHPTQEVYPLVISGDKACSPWMFVHSRRMQSVWSILPPTTMG